MKPPPASIVGFGWEAEEEKSGEDEEAWMRRGARAYSR